MPDNNAKVINMGAVRARLKEVEDGMEATMGKLDEATGLLEMARCFARKFVAEDSEQPKKAPHVHVSTLLTASREESVRYMRDAAEQSECPDCRISLKRMADIMEDLDDMLSVRQAQIEDDDMYKEDKCLACPIYTSLEAIRDTHDKLEPGKRSYVLNMLADMWLRMDNGWPDNITTSGPTKEMIERLNKKPVKDYQPVADDVSKLLSYIDHMRYIVENTFNHHERHKVISAMFEDLCRFRDEIGDVKAEVSKEDPIPGSYDWRYFNGAWHHLVTVNRDGVEFHYMDGVEQKMGEQPRPKDNVIPAKQLSEIYFDMMRKLDRFQGMLNESLVHNETYGKLDLAMRSLREDTDKFGDALANRDDIYEESRKNILATLDRMADMPHPSTEILKELLGVKFSIRPIGGQKVDYHGPMLVEEWSGVNIGEYMRDKTKKPLMECESIHSGKMSASLLQSIKNIREAVGMKEDSLEKDFILSGMFKRLCDNIDKGGVPEVLRILTLEEPLDCYKDLR